MKPEQKRRLEARGWKFGSAEEFLELTPDEAAMVELRLKLADAVRLLRKDKNITQTQLAKLMGSSQSRVAELEAAADSVSLDLLIRSFLAMGATTDDLAEVIGSSSLQPAQAVARPWRRIHDQGQEAELRSSRRPPRGRLRPHE